VHHRPADLPGDVPAEQQRHPAEQRHQDQHPEDPGHLLPGADPGLREQCVEAGRDPGVDGSDPVELGLALPEQHRVDRARPGGSVQPYVGVPMQPVVDRPVLRRDQPVQGRPVGGEPAKTGPVLRQAALLLVVGL
jgi:hypothetical protein